MSDDDLTVISFHIGLDLEPARVVYLAVKEGQAVQAGDLLVVIEAANGTHQFHAPKDGEVGLIRVRNGDPVTPGYSLMVLREPSKTTPVAEGGSKHKTTLRQYILVALALLVAVFWVGVVFTAFPGNYLSFEAFLALGVGMGAAAIVFALLDRWSFFRQGGEGSGAGWGTVALFAVAFGVGVIFAPVREVEQSFSAMIVNSSSLFETVQTGGLPVQDYAELNETRKIILDGMAEAKQTCRDLNEPGIKTHYNAALYAIKQGETEFKRDQPDDVFAYRLGKNPIIILFYLQTDLADAWDVQFFAAYSVNPTSICTYYGELPIY